MGNKKRLDQFLVDAGFFPSRSRARDAIIRQSVKVAGVLIAKPGYLVAPDALIEIADEAQHYVARSALKLIALLDHFHIDVRDKYALDIGASTGGFSQVLLERGARHVLCLDVGHGQLHQTLRQDSRISVMENCNVRFITPQQLKPHPIDLITCDVSFISLKLALPGVFSYAKAGTVALILVKPQFEVGRDGIGKGGLVKDPEMALASAQDIVDWVNNFPGWQVNGFIPSPIKGGDGNEEYLLFGEKSRCTKSC